MAGGRRTMVTAIIISPLLIATLMTVLSQFREESPASVHPVRDSSFTNYGSSASSASSASGHVPIHNVSAVVSSAVVAVERNQKLLEESRARENMLGREVMRLRAEVAALRGSGGGGGSGGAFNFGRTPIQASPPPQPPQPLPPPSQPFPPSPPPPQMSPQQFLRQQSTPRRQAPVFKHEAAAMAPARPAASSAPPSPPTISSFSSSSSPGYSPAAVRALSACVVDNEVNDTLCVEPDIQFRTAWRVHLLPQDNPGKGWRFYHLISQGLEKHPYAQVVSSVAEADCVVWLPTSTSQPPPSGQLSIAPPAPTTGGGGNNGGNDNGKSSYSKVLIVLDEGDGSGFYPRASKIPYTVYFKRSWVNKRDGHFTGVPRRLPHAYLPMVYSASDAYHSGVFESVAQRTREVVCSLRCFDRQPARCRVLGWVKAAAQELDLKNSLLGEVNHGGRKEINKGYFGAMRAARIVVTCNPSHWEGDFRLFEAMVSGALVFVDEMWGPQPFPLRHGEHVVVYDTTSQDDFKRKLAYYLSHPAEARRIARNGYLHVLKYHRAVSRFDFFLRSAHHQDASAPGASAQQQQAAPQYLEVGQQIKGDITKAMIIKPKPANWVRR